MKQLLTLLYCLLVSTLLQAQSSRHLVSIDLYNKENRAYLKGGISLPEVVLQGIATGKLQPVQINYEEGNLVNISPIDFSKLMEKTVVPSDELVDIEKLNDTLPPVLTAYDFQYVLLDDSQFKDNAKKINYLGLRSAAPEDVKVPVEFYVAYNELKQILDARQVLWYQNAGAFTLNEKVVHTADEYLASIISDATSEDVYNQYFQVKKTKNGRLATLQQYGSDYELIKEAPVSTYAATGKKGEVLFMSQALQRGQYKAHQDKVIQTKLPEAQALKYQPAYPKKFTVYQTEGIYLDHPKNAHFFIPEQELPVLLLEAARNRRIAAYTNDSLSIKMTVADLSKQMQMETTGVMILEVGEKPEESNDAATVEMLPTDLTVLQMVWQVSFNPQGEIESKVPHALGLLAPGKLSPTGFEQQVAYFSFKEVYGFLKEDERARYTSPTKGHMLNDLLKENYTSFLLKTSHLSVARKEKQKYPLVIK
ncbi:hypothetical protein [Nibribacter koreensis]|uniref:DUF3945 domain-containing protein n=1 Tax=Nibribacter koreensis TaxID=1084519 RepID=A0ABP8F941_9BACT